MQSKTNFYITCFLHQCSKVLKIFCEAETCKVLHPKVNQIQSKLVASTFILNEEVKLCVTGNLLYLCEDMIVSAE